MESSRPVAFFALDVAPPPPLIIPLSATDIIVPWVTTAWSSEPLPRDLQPLANTLQHIKAARFKPYPADVPHSRSSSLSSASSPSPSPSPPLQHVDKGKGRQTPALPLRPPSPQPLDQGDEDSDTETGGGGGGDDEEELQDERVFRQPSRATVKRILIPQPKRIGSLGLKQLGVELNWSDDTYEHMVKHAEKIFPKYLRNDVCWKTEAVKISFQKRAQQHGKHLNTRQILREFAEPLRNYVDHWPLAQIAQRLCKKKAEKVRTEAVKRTATVVQEAVAPRPRVITVKKKKAGGTPGPTTAPLPPRRTSWQKAIGISSCQSIKKNINSEHACLKYPPPSPDTLSSLIIPPDPTLKPLLAGSSTVRAAEHDTTTSWDEDILYEVMRAAVNMLAVGILSDALCSGDTPSGQRVTEEGRKWKGGKNGDIGVVVDVRSLDDLNLAVSAAVSASAEGHPWKSGMNSMRGVVFSRMSSRSSSLLESRIRCDVRGENEAEFMGERGQGADLHHALRLERDSIDNHSGGYRNLLCTIARLPDDDHPEYTIRVYDPKYHFLGALHYNPRVPDRAQFLPDNPNHRATHVIRLVTEKKVPDSRVYFDFSIQRSLRTICRLAHLGLSNIGARAAPSESDSGNACFTGLGITENDA
ncbi:hypothetical protein IW261DRAFT_1427212 [Armillaria novae-zelandiae]|uniref:Uncharacterized protein n=1 Tax=Armillaria novae-zelandiae TaxID=153914 RepID=A0AA39NHE0_9AGAR|nr:hypothetical protein IW261DRAFT_1427212 [Armillaria novae-zelandiae]